jgi:flagellar motor switch protein FliN/FliY
MMRQPPSSSSSTVHREASLASDNFGLGHQLNALWQQWLNTFSVQPVGAFKLVACGHKLPPTWQMDQYLTYHYSLQHTALEEGLGHAPSTKPALEVRLSSGFQQACLTQWLGGERVVASAKKKSSPNPITSLEQFLLKTFIHQCFEGLQTHWCQPAWQYHQQQLATAQLTSASAVDETLIHFAWIYVPSEGLSLTEPADNDNATEYTPLALEEMPVAVPKLILSIPQYCLPTQSHPSPSFQQTTGASTLTETLDFLKTQGIVARSNATLSAGYTLLSTADLKALEPDDLIVLEESNFQQLLLKHPTLEVYLPFPISGLTYWPYQLPQQPQLSSPPLSTERVYPAMMMMSSPQVSHNQPANASFIGSEQPWHSLPQSAQHSLWDALKVDVHAEFAPAKIPVGHLKQMSEGLIVEVADLLKNQIQLVVNGSVLAHGQLVIVGDKFGVLLTKVVGKEEPSLPALGDGVPDQLGMGDDATQGHSTGDAMLLPPSEVSQPQPSVNPYEGIDPNLVQAALQMGIDPFLAQTALQLGMDLQQVLQAAQQQGMDPNQFLTLVLQQQGIAIPTPEQRRQQQASQFQGGSAGSMMSRQPMPEGEAPEEYVQEVSRANEMLSEVDSLLNEDYEEEDYEEEEEN